MRGVAIALASVVLASDASADPINFRGGVGGGGGFAITTLRIQVVAAVVESEHAVARTESPHERESVGRGSSAVPRSDQPQVPCHAG